MKKKIMLGLLCLALCLPCAWVIAKVVHMIRYTDGDYVFVVLDDGTAQIRQYRGRDMVVEIPAQMKKRYPVSGIADKAFEYRFWIRQVTMPDGLEEIGEGSFSGCYGLEEVLFGQNLSRIGAKAFAGCRSLKQMVLPGQVMTVTIGQGGAANGGKGGVTAFGPLSAEDGKAYTPSYTDIASGRAFGRSGVKEPLSGSGDGGKGGKGGAKGERHEGKSKDDHGFVTENWVVDIKPGKGKPGSPGAAGCVMIYWDR